MAPGQGLPGDEATPLVSLILLSYQYERYLGQAIESVLAQTYPRWQLVVVDDGSRDGSVALARSYADPRITVLALGENRGAGNAYNAAYALCRGELVGSVDADDYLAPARLERQVARFAERPDLDVLGTYVVQVDAEGRAVDGLAAEWVNAPRDLDRPESWVANYLCHSSVLLRRTAHDRVGAFSTALDLAPDYDLWLRCFVHGLRIAVLPEPLTFYRVHGSSVSDVCRGSRLFVELAYLYGRYIAPDVARGRPELAARSLRWFARKLAALGPLDRAAVLREVAAGPLHARDAAAFLADFPRRCGDAWPAAATALDGADESGRGQLRAAPRPPPRRPRRLVVVDDHFPEVTSAFRIREFNEYLERFDCTVYSTAPRFADAHREYAALFPRHADRVRPFDPAEAAAASLVYFTFLANAHRHLAWLEQHALPFVLTLYPGGRLQLHDLASDLELLEVGRSPLLRRLIATQRVTERYVVAGDFCPADKVQLIYGGVFPAEVYRDQTPPRRRYPAEKATFDLCFVAFKYMPRGADKGYDTFVAAARELAARSPDYRFHVVGNFSPADVPIDGVEDRFTFQPPQPTSFFPPFFAGMDALVSPNVPFRLGPGAFDGFPTGCAVEAALAGVAVFCSDELGENEWFRPDVELCLVEPRAEAVVRRVEEYRGAPARLHALAAAGQRRALELFGREAQLAPRCALLESLL